jgi:hypothetical protein
VTGRLLPPFFGQREEYVVATKVCSGLAVPSGGERGRHGLWVAGGGGCS